MVINEKCIYVRQAQGLFLAWAKALNYEPDVDDIVAFANGLYPNLLNETDANGRTVQVRAKQLE